MTEEVKQGDSITEDPLLSLARLTWLGDERQDDKFEKLYWRRDMSAFLLHMQAYVILGYDGTEPLSGCYHDGAQGSLPPEIVDYPVGWFEVANEETVDIYHNGTLAGTFGFACRGPSWKAWLTCNDSNDVYAASDDRPHWSWETVLDNG